MIFYINIKNTFIENLIRKDKIKIPTILYHATYKPLLENIISLGLGNTKQTYLEDSIPGVVYLADDPYIAESYAETNENIENEDWLDEIIILEINTNSLDKTKLFVDKNVKLDEGEENATWEYHGIIPWKNIKIFNSTITKDVYDPHYNFKQMKENKFKSKFDLIYEDFLNISFCLVQNNLDLNKYLYVMNEDSDPNDKNTIWTVKIYENNLKIDDRKCYLIYSREILIGAVDICNADGNYFYIENFVILRKYRGKGYRKLITKKIINFIKQNNRDKDIALLVNKTNEIAIHVYETQGFKITGENGEYLIMKIKAEK